MSEAYPPPEVTGELVPWDAPDPLDEVEVLSLNEDMDWFGLLWQYAEVPVDESGRRVWPATPLAQCLLVARRSQAKSVVIETRYRDRDYRSEYLAFYAQGFADVPPSAHRLHFFASDIDAQSVWQLPVDERGQVDASAVGYLGYVVVRPPEVGGVGRVMLVPPPEQIDAVRVAVSEQVTFYGQQLTVRAVPFMQQDTQLAVCAHAAVWMCAYIAFRRGRIPRHNVAEVSLSADQRLGLGRALPSDGLSAVQVNGMFHQLGIPAAFYPIAELPSADLRTYDAARSAPELDLSDAPELARRVGAAMCRYLSGAIPVVMHSANHAIVVCGFERAPQDADRGAVTLIYHDDQRGPYLAIGASELGRVLQGRELAEWAESPSDERAEDEPAPEWQAIFAPLPEKLWLAAEEAERIGAALLIAQSRKLVASGAPHPAAAVLSLDAAGDLAFRTYPVDANTFKRRLWHRDVDSAVLRTYRLARWPRLLWVIEAVDRNARLERDAKGRQVACVLGEVVLDPTRSAAQPGVCAIHLPGYLAVLRTDGETQHIPGVGAAPSRSGGIGPA